MIYENTSAPCRSEKVAPTTMFSNIFSICIVDCTRHNGRGFFLSDPRSTGSDLSSWIEWYGSHGKGVNITRGSLNDIKCRCFSSLDRIRVRTGASATGRDRTRRRRRQRLRGRSSWRHRLHRRRRRRGRQIPERCDDLPKLLLEKAEAAVGQDRSFRRKSLGPDGEDLHLREHQRLLVLHRRQQPEDLPPHLLNSPDDLLDVLFVHPVVGRSWYRPNCSNYPYHLVNKI